MICMTNKELSALHKSMKAEILKRRESARYFNIEFLKTYIAAQNKREENLKKGIDDSYRPENAPHVLLFHCWDGVYNSRFYTDNSCAYCTFLEIAHGVLWN